MIPLNKISIIDINSLITVSSDKGRQETIQNRQSFGLSFCINGQITYNHNGNITVSDKNNAIFLPQGQTYTLHGDKKGLFPVINFTSNEMICDTVTAIPIQNIDAYLIDYEQIKNLFVFERNRAKAMSIFYNILHRLHIQTQQSYGILEPALKYLENNYHNASLSNTDLSQQCNISEIYFRRLFNDQFGVTPKKYIIDIRIQKARQLLTDGIFKVSTIAEQCGFSNQYHFSRVFKYKTGLTPTEYMKQNKIYKI